jgi:hypothetical protein
VKQAASPSIDRSEVGLDPAARAVGEQQAGTRAPGDASEPGGGKRGSGHANLSLDETGHPRVTLRSDTGVSANVARRRSQPMVTVMEAAAAEVIECRAPAQIVGVIPPSMRLSLPVTYSATAGLAGS